MVTTFLLPFLGGAATVVIGLFVYRSIVNRRNEERFQNNEEKPI